MTCCCTCMKKSKHRQQRPICNRNRHLMTLWPKSTPSDDLNTHRKQVGIRNANHCRLSSAQFTWGGKLNLVSRHWHEKRGKKQFCANRHSDLSSNIGHHLLSLVDQVHLLLNGLISEPLRQKSDKKFGMEVMWWKILHNRIALWSWDWWKQTLICFSNNSKKQQCSQ
jgi:hypothetical protein